MLFISILGAVYHYTSCAHYMPCIPILTALGRRIPTRCPFEVYQLVSRPRAVLKAHPKGVFQVSEMPKYWIKRRHNFRLPGGVNLGSTRRNAVRSA